MTDIPVTDIYALSTHVRTFFDGKDRRGYESDTVKIDAS